jgi:hypothetical protein
MVTTLKQLQRIWRNSDETLDPASDTIGVTVASLSRKLHGLQPITLKELDRFAKLLKFKVVLKPK